MKDVLENLLLVFSPSFFNIREFLDVTGTFSSANNPGLTTGKNEKVDPVCPCHKIYGVEAVGLSLSSMLKKF